MRYIFKLESILSPLLRNLSTKVSKHKFPPSLKFEHPKLLKNFTIYTNINKFRTLKHLPKHQPITTERPQLSRPNKTPPIYKNHFLLTSLIQIPHKFSSKLGFCTSGMLPNYSNIYTQFLYVYAHTRFTFMFATLYRAYNLLFTCLFTLLYR